MDRHFLEFWGNFLINAAKGQQQLDDLTQWMQQGFKGFEELSTLFSKAYGLQKPPESTPDYQQTWHKATREFKESLNAYFSLMGVIPLSEHLALLEKYEALKKENAEQLTVIQRLRGLLGERDSNQTAVVENFKELVSRQSEQFQKLMDSFGSYVKEASSSESGGKKPAKR
jgi:hypothetical protein